MSWQKAHPGDTPGELLPGEDIQIEPTDLVALLEETRQLARAGGGRPEALAQGAFAMYPMEDGGVMFVVDSTELGGVRHTRITPGMIRAVTALAAGGPKLGAVKAFFGRKPKAVEVGDATG